MTKAYPRMCRGVLHRCVLAVLAGALVFLVPQTSRAQARTQTKTTLQRTPLKTPVGQPQFKGIWEPVNYGQDLRLTDVYFVTPDVGYVSGAAGTILKTADGGRTWTPQLGGDPQSQEAEISKLRFVDRTHGWALQAMGFDCCKLLRTSDGENWEQAGTIPPGWGLIDYQFTSPSTGVLADGNNNASHIFRTADGGRTWKEVLPPSACKVSVEVGGLRQERTCIFLALHMASPTVGYAVGAVNNVAAVADMIVVAKTTDGGLTWRLSTAAAPGPVTFPFAQGYTLFFTDENSGYFSFSGVAIGSERLLATNDGGQTWRGVPGSGGPQIRFADPEVGWAFGHLNGGLDYQLKYATDGGKRWASRTFRFPTEVTGFSLPRRDRGYIVGNHGMIYRYRVVPVSYTVAHAIDAPAMPAFDSPVPGELAKLNDVLTKLRLKLPAPAQGGNQAPPQTGGQSSGQAGGQSGGFQQEVGAAGGGYVDACCGPLVQQLETTANSFATDVPAFSQRFRNLNLILEGLNLVNSIVNQANTLKQSIRALRQTKNAQAAAAALNTVQSQVNDISSGGGFVQDTSLPPQQP